ncbi:MAG: hemolysin family protein [Bacteroidaceae bacterium]|nr:hemolysin family protein [Bacteroidaceae bacterium]
MELIIIYMLLSLVISAMCSVLEATILSTPMSYITTLETQGTKGWKRLKDYKSNIDRPISAILIVNTIANTVGASLVGSQAANFASATFNTSEDVSLFIGAVSGVFTFLILVFSEIVPKTIGSTYWRKLAIPASRVIHVLVIMTYLLVIILEKITHVLGSSSSQESVTRDEVAAMVSVGTEEGVLEKKENRMIQNLLKLDSITAHEIMTPSVVVTMAEEEMTLRDFYGDEEFKNHSRIPVFKGEESDYITGYVLRQDILESLAEDKFDVTLGQLARPILSFSEKENVSDIWEKLLEKKEHISIIIDEYGCLRGIVTLEDVIETMLGFEIVDEKDEVVDMQELAKAQWKQMQKEQHK